LSFLLAHTTECTDCTRRITLAAAMHGEDGVNGILSKIVDNGIVLPASNDEH
jgi:hypothetical protein